MPPKKSDKQNNQIVWDHPMIMEGRSTGFSRLINEKTFMRESNPVDDSVECLCPSLPTDEQLKELQALIPYVEKLTADIVSKTKANPLYVSYSDCFIANKLPNDFIWHTSRGGDPVFDIFMPIWAPVAKIVHNIPGYPVLAIPPVTRAEEGEENSFDMLEHLRGVGHGKKNYLCPGSAVRATFRLVTASILQIGKLIGGDFQAESVRLDEEMNTIHVVCLVSPRYVKLSLATATGDGEETERSAEEKDDFLRLVLRLQPVFSFQAKDRIYLVSRPYDFDTHLDDEECWRLSYHVKEDQLLSKIFCADRCNRLRGWVGLARLCEADPELSAIKPDHIKAALLHSVEAGVDELVVRWQRQSLLVCLRQLLLQLRSACSARQLRHYSLFEMDLFKGQDSIALSRAMVRCSLLFKSDNAVLRAVDETLSYFQRKARINSQSVVQKMTTQNNKSES